MGRAALLAKEMGPRWLVKGFEMDVRTVQRLESLGATRVEADACKEFGQTWFVLADQEGNEFCEARDPEGAGDE